jgi:hypothetical protein
MWIYRIWDASADTFAAEPVPFTSSGRTTARSNWDDQPYGYWTL